MHVSTTITVERPEEDVDVTVSAEATVEYGRVHLSEIEADGFELTPAEVSRAEDALADRVLSGC